MPQTRYKFSRPRSTAEQLTDLAADLERLRESIVTIGDGDGEVYLHFPVGNPKHRPKIHSRDNSCLSHPQTTITFIPSLLTPGSSTNTEPSARNIKGTVILQYNESSKNRSSHIDDVFYSDLGDETMSLHTLEQDRTWMIGGNFKGGTRVNSTATPSTTTPGFSTPGLFSLTGATYTPASYPNPDHPQFHSLYDTSTTETTGSQSSKRPEPSEQYGTTKPKRQRGRSPDQSAGSSKKMISAISSGSSPSAFLMQTVDGHSDDQGGSRNEHDSTSQRSPSTDLSQITPASTAIEKDTQQAASGKRRIWES